MDEATIYMTDMTPAHDDRYMMNRVMEEVSHLPWEARKKAVAAYKSAEAKRLGAGAGLLLYHALRMAGVTDFTLIENEHGKPALVNGTVSFNLSHSKDRVICAVTTGGGPVGADIEPIRNGKKKIFDRCFSKEERMWADERFGKLENEDEAFTRLWTVKESFLKMKGTGFSGDIYSNDLSKEDVFFYTQFHDGYHVSFCANNEIIVHFEPIRLDKLRVYGYK